jgi:CDP-glycerol glycerophosphotransferase
MIDRFPKMARRYRQFVVSLSRLIHGVDKQKVVFSCFRGRSYGDNPRVISEKLHAMYPQARQIWLFNQGYLEKNIGEFPDYVTPVYIRSRRAYRELGTARVWVDNFTKDNVLHPVKKRQYYIQTWHGDRAIKKICYDAFPNEAYRIEEEADLVLTGSDFGQRMFRTAFRYNGAFLNEGCPRNDMLVRNDPDDYERIRRALGVPQDVRLLLYAPTYREDTKIISMKDKFDPLRTLETLRRKTNSEWMLLFRAHYKTERVDLESLRGKIMDVTQWEIMSDLLLVADCLITDYSSCAMDYAILGRPVFFYQADYEDYISKRDVYFEPKTAPFMIAYSQDELERLILDTDAEDAKKNCRAMFDYFGIRETGHATESVCNYIIDRLK